MFFGIVLVSSFLQCKLRKIAGEGGGLVCLGICDDTGPGV